MFKGTKAQVRDEVMERGLTDAVFILDPVLLPEDTPADVVSAWIRLHGQGRKDAETIRKWING